MKNKGKQIEPMKTRLLIPKNIEPFINEWYKYIHNERIRTARKVRQLEMNEHKMVK